MVHYCLGIFISGGGDFRRFNNDRLFHRLESRRNIVMGSYDSVAAISRRLFVDSDSADAERREEPRIAALESASVRAIRSRMSYDATITDVSSRGLSLTSPEGFAVGTAVLVEWCAGFFPGTVRHANQSGENSWTIGIEVEPIPGCLTLLATLKQSAHEKNRDQVINARVYA
jgi:hypothetical protein